MIDVTDPGARTALRCLVTDARQQLPPRLEMRYAIKRTEEGYALLEQGDQVGFQSNTTDLLDWIYTRIYRRALEYASLCGWVRLHGGLVALADGRRVLLAGTTQSGKTTTIIRLLLDGAQVHGDEYVLVRDAVAIAVPRLMRLEPRTIALLPELALAQLLPELPDGSARMLDPSWIAGDWSIDAGPIDEVIVLDGRGQRARLQPAAATDVMPELVAEALPNGEDTATVLRQIARILGPAGASTARCWRLTAGSPGTTAGLVRSLPPR